MKTGAVLGVQGDGPAARFATGTVSRVVGTKVFVVVPGFDDGLAFQANYAGRTPTKGAECVVAVMTDTAEAWIVSWDGPAPPETATPKACKLVMNVNDFAPPASTVVAARYNIVAYNDGPFVLPAAGGFFTGIQVPDAGLYEVVFQHSAIANTQLYLVGILINGSQNMPSPDLSAAQVDTGATLSNGVFIVIHQARTVVKLPAGALVQGFNVQATSGGGPTTSSANLVWLAVTKLERPV